jgi:hypothetical protein
MGRQWLGVARSQWLCRADLRFRTELPTLGLDRQGMDEGAVVLIEAATAAARARVHCQARTG